MSDWIIQTISDASYFGIFLLMLLESIFPPLPSELIIPFAGFSAARGELSLIGVLLAATSGAVVGMIPWYLAGRLFGLERVRRLADRFGRWFTLNADEIDTATAWFHRYGPGVGFFGRLVPLIRTMISVPAGLARMPALLFFGASAMGALLWNTILVGSGYVLDDHYQLVEMVLDQLTSIVLGAVVLFYFYRLVVWRPSRAR